MSQPERFDPEVYMEDARATYEAGITRAMAAYERVIDEQRCQDAPTSREVVDAVLRAFLGGVDA